MLRDAALLLVAVLLIGWSKTVNQILSDAGFEEGSIAGFKWKKNLVQSDRAVSTGLSAIHDLKLQNNALSTALSDLKSDTTNTELKEKIKNILQFNNEVVANVEKAQASLEANISANSALVQKIHTSTGEEVTWGVVYGGDKSIVGAQDEIKKAPKLGLTNAAIYYRQGSYRSVATTGDRLVAEQLLTKAKGYHSDSYIVNMSTWCPNKTNKGDHFECSSP
jgi:hypothetical protein